MSDPLVPCSVIDRAKLPNDIEALKDMLCEYMAVHTRQSVTISDQKIAIQALTKRVARLEERFINRARIHVGQRPEKRVSLT